MSKVSIVIPCYFNELNIAETYKVLVRDVFEKRKDIDESMGGGSFCYHQLCLVGKRLPVHQDGVRPFTYRF